MDALLALEAARAAVSNRIVGIDLVFGSCTGTAYNCVLEPKSEGRIEFDDCLDMEVRLLKRENMSKEYGLEFQLETIIFLDKFSGLKLHFYSEDQLAYTDYVSLNCYTEPAAWYNVECFKSVKYEFVPKEALLPTQHVGVDVVGGWELPYIKSMIDRVN